MASNDASGAAAFQRTRTQEPAWRDASEALIRGGAMQLQQGVVSGAPAPPRKLLSGVQRDGGFHALPFFRPNTGSYGRKTLSVKPEHLRDRVSLTRGLPPTLKDECLDRLDRISARAPPVRRASWSQDSNVEIPESEDGLLDSTTEDLLKEDDLTFAGDQDEQGMLSEFNSKPFAHDAQNSQASHVSEVPEVTLSNLVLQNQELAAAAGLQASFPWRHSPDTEKEQHDGALSPREDVTQEDATLCPRGRNDIDTSGLYTDCGPSEATGPLLSTKASPHWRYTAQSKMETHPRQPKTTKKVDPAQSPKAAAVLCAAKSVPTLKDVNSTSALPQSLVDVQKAVAAAKMAAANGPARNADEGPERGTNSMLRASLRLVMQSA
eukprot:TRINITY_DN18441_c0_g1_i1.p1 TRINITY_DN18441_c0_g1~~TRINITY_DN18441_c0_g1_i1.p1  ORF type:complete len:387 (-),score=61.82 TRINITY_DN18441_c0_g1_i1:62-1198(-)